MDPSGETDQPKEILSDPTETEINNSEVEDSSCSNKDQIVQDTKETSSSGHTECSNSNESNKNCTASSSSCSSKEKTPTPPFERQNCIYHIKWISLNNHKTPIVTQNENGPCPLIALINVLILKGRVKLPLTVDIVTSDKLLQHLADCLLDSIPKNLPEGTQLNYEQNINDAMAILPKLQTGLDVNVKFTGIADFEYTPECIIFDLLRIPLYHGWLIDPQLSDVIKAVGTFSYNQIVEKIINFKSSLDSDKVLEALVAESFLEKTASQLTYHGLYELISSLHEDELCILFRNNHFISLVKHSGTLYQLVTDQGFLNENVVWESLNNIDGDGQFVDTNFILVPPKPSTDVLVPQELNVGQQIDQDYLVALTLHNEQQMQQRNEMEWEEFKKSSLGATSELPDEEIARRLQAEENKVSPSQQEISPDRQPPVPPSTPTSGRSKNRDCVIL